MTPASRACADSCSAQRLNDVPHAGSATARPAAIEAHAAAKSGTRIRHDTPSTAR